MPRTRENKIEAHLVERAERAGALVRKLAYIGRRGAPDRMVVWGTQRGERVGFPCQIDFVELKAPGQRPDPHQEREHARLRSMGCNVFVLDSIEAVDAYIEERS